eukprot:3939017-Rhodomonas_salina.1
MRALEKGNGNNVDTAVVTGPGKQNVNAPLLRPPETSNCLRLKIHCVEVAYAAGAQGLCALLCLPVARDELEVEFEEVDLRDALAVPVLYVPDEADDACGERSGVVEPVELQHVVGDARVCAERVRLRVHGVAARRVQERQWLHKAHAVGAGRVCVPLLAQGRLCCVEEARLGVVYKREKKELRALLTGVQRCGHDVLHEVVDSRGVDDVDCAESLADEQLCHVGLKLYAIAEAVLCGARAVCEQQLSVAVEELLARFCEPLRAHVPEGVHVLHVSYACVLDLALGVAGVEADEPDLGHAGKDIHDDCLDICLSLHAVYEQCDGEQQAAKAGPA